METWRKLARHCSTRPIIYEDPSGHSIKSVTRKFFKGVWDSGKDTVEGVVYVVKHPVKTAKGLGNMAMHPVKTVKTIYKSGKKTVNEKIIKGSAEDRAYAGGYLTGEIGQAFLTGGTGKALKSTKGTKVVKLGSRGKKATKVIDKGSDAGRYGTKGKKVFKTRGKAGKKATSRGNTKLPNKVKSSAGKSSRQGGKGASNKKEIHRPYIRKTVRKEVEARAPKTADGKFIDPNTGMVIEGKYDLGHKYGNEFWREKKKAQSEGLTQKQFNDRMNNPEYYQIESPSSNRSHKYEKK